MECVKNGPNSVWPNLACPPKARSMTLVKKLAQDVAQLCTKITVVKTRMRHPVPEISFAITNYSNVAER